MYGVSLLAIFLAVILQTTKGQYNPCHYAYCPIGSYCQPTHVRCVTTPCPPQTRCVRTGPTIVEKAGRCPAPGLKLFGCRNNCKYDNECFGVEKCCRTVCGTTCLTPAIDIVKPGRCPVLPTGLGGCVPSCEDDRDCSSSYKCCDNGCTRVCSATDRDITRANQQRGSGPSLSRRRGKCPSEVEGQSSCADECNYDHQCPFPMKCCKYGCASRCLFPTEGAPEIRAGSCPRSHPFAMSGCVAQCDHDGHCPHPQKCCKSGCSRSCLYPVVSYGDRPVHDGYCPIVPAQYEGMCWDLCHSDRDCFSNQKCCYNGCGRTCMKPVYRPVTMSVYRHTVPQQIYRGAPAQAGPYITTKPGHCPSRLESFLIDGECGVQCARDVECMGRMKCCIRRDCGAKVCTQPSSRNSLR